MNSRAKGKKGDMKRNAFTALLSIVLLLMVSAVAESPKDKRIKTLVDYKTELSLTEKQIADIRDALTSYQTTVTEQRTLLRQYEAEYSKLVSDHASLDLVKQKLRQVTDTGFNLRYVDILTSRKVEGILSAEQLTKWRNIQSKVRGTKP